MFHDPLDPYAPQNRGETAAIELWDSLSEAQFLQRFMTIRKASSRLLELAAHDVALHDNSQHATSIFIALGELDKRLDQVQTQLDAHD